MELPNRIGLITLACRDVERETQAVYETLQRVDGVELLEEPSEAFWGGGFSWRDPEGNVWDLAWARGTTFDERGGVFFP